MHFNSANGSSLARTHKEHAFFRKIVFSPFLLRPIFFYSSNKNVRALKTDIQQVNFIM